MTAQRSLKSLLKTFQSPTVKAGVLGKKQQNKSIIEVCVYVREGGQEGVGSLWLELARFAFCVYFKAQLFYQR